MSNSQKLPYVYGVTFTNISDIKTIINSIGRQPTNPIDSTNSITLILNSDQWKDGVINNFVINNIQGNQPINLVATNDSNLRTKALQTALNLNVSGASVIFKLIKFGAGTSPIQINGVNVLNENTKVAYILIQANNIISGLEENTIMTILNT